MKTQTTLGKSAKTFGLITSLRTYTEDILARLTEIETRLNELRELPRADATIWEREGKNGVTYYLTHHSGSPRYKAGEVSRRERIGRGNGTKSACEKQIQRHTEYQELSNEHETLENQYDTATHHIRAAINATGHDQPDGKPFYYRYY